MGKQTYMRDIYACGQCGAQFRGKWVLQELYYTAHPPDLPTCHTCRNKNGDFKMVGIVQRIGIEFKTVLEEQNDA